MAGGRLYEDFVRVYGKKKCREEEIGRGLGALDGMSGDLIGHESWAFRSRQQPLADSEMCMHLL